MKFQQKLKSSIKNNNSLLCIGLDPNLKKIPQHLLKLADPFFTFNKSIVDSTYDLVCAYKVQIAHYSALGLKGTESLIKTVSYIKHTHPEIPIILDSKRADISSTSALYAKEAFDIFKADAVTVNPYLGLDSLIPFLQRKDKGIIILCRTTNKSASDFQDIQVRSQSQTMPFFLYVAKKVHEWNKTYKNCLLVVGATWQEQLAKVRKIEPNMFFLVPGIGTQGGDLEKTLSNGLRKDRSGLIINSSRAIIYASDKANFANEARKEALKFKHKINKCR